MLMQWPYFFNSQKSAGGQTPESPAIALTHPDFAHETDEIAWRLMLMHCDYWANKSLAANADMDIILMTERIVETFPLAVLPQNILNHLQTLRLFETNRQEVSWGSKLAVLISKWLVNSDKKMLHEEILQKLAQNSAIQLEVLQQSSEVFTGAFIKMIFQHMKHHLGKTWEKNEGTKQTEVQLMRISEWLLQKDLLRLVELQDELRLAIESPTPNNRGRQIK